MSVRAAIVQTLEAVPEIGRVHSRMRYARHERDFRAHFLTDDDKLRGWFISRHSFEEKQLTEQVNTIEERWRITGLFALVDENESEIIFDQLIDAVAAAFRADRGLGGAVLTTDASGRSGVQLIQSEPVSFAGVLCHRAVLELRTVRHVETPIDDDEGQLTTLHVGISPEIGAAHEDDYEIVGGAA
jgi:hypothetical protein